MSSEKSSRFAGKALVIIPTYNERDNIERIVGAVLASAPEVDVLVVDDSSPDGTGALAQKLSERDKRVHLLSRAGKQGLGKAYLAAFAWGLSRDYQAFVEMDADFSHRPEDLPKLLAVLSSADFAAGSRYVAGGSTVNWSMLRKIISRCGSIYARTILQKRLWDWTGGFNAWKRSVLEGIALERVRSEGYSFQIELKYRSLRAGFRGVEIPIIFEDRRVGKSKMSSRIVLEAFYQVWSMRFQK